MLACAPFRTRPVHAPCLPACRPHLAATFATPSRTDDRRHRHAPRLRRHRRQFRSRGAAEIAANAGAGRFLGRMVRAVQAAGADPGKARRRIQRRLPPGQGRRRQGAATRRGAFQVRSIPTVFLVKDGQLVDGFPGALPEGQLREFLTHHGIEPAAAAAPEDSRAEAAPPLDPHAEVVRLRGEVAATAGQRRTQARPRPGPAARPAPRTRPSSCSTPCPPTSPPTTAPAARARASALPPC